MFRWVSRGRVFFFLCILGGPAAQAADDYSQWSHNAGLYFNTTPDGANVTGTVTGFPLLVRLTAANFSFAQSLGHGQDLRFSKASGGAHLAYQIDRWDSARGLAEVWVKMDTVYGNASTQSILMYWGKADAADSSNGNAVFDSAGGFSQVWHLGGTGSTPRANSVAGGHDAVPTKFGGGETVDGLIGLTDSLNGGSDGKYFQIGDGYEDVARGFTYSVWSYPTAASNWARLLDLGNGPGLDEIVLQRSGNSTDITFDAYNSNNKGRTQTVAGAFPLNQWQFFAVTVSGSAVKMYRNGSLIASDTLGITLSATRRAFNYIGRNDWAANQFYAGLIDEPELSHAARSADWIKLSYANQNANQNLISFSQGGTNQCQIKFSVPADTTLPEGSVLVLKGQADCANGYSWEVVDGPAPRILDPEVKSLQVFLPRITHDTVIDYRFSAQYDDSLRSKSVAVTIKETIPDPIFSLPANVNWDGADSLLIKPTVTNIASISASRDSVLNYSWTLSGLDADTAWRGGGLMLLDAPADGTLTVGLCLDNNGPHVCKTMDVTVQRPVGLAPKSRRASAVTMRKRYDSTGRLLFPRRQTPDQAPAPVFSPR